MSSMIRLCFLKYPPSTLQFGQNFDFSLTVYNDLGVSCGTDIAYLNLKISIIEPRESKNKYDNKSSKLRLLLNGNNKGLIKQHDNQLWLKLNANSEYLEYNFNMCIEYKAKGSAPDVVQLKFESCTLEDVLDLPGGNLVDDIYFLSLYSLIIKLNNKINKEEEQYSLRYYEFNKSNLRYNDYIKVVELPFGKSLATHCWDCSWVGLDFLTRLINNNLSNSILKLKNEQHIQILKDNIFKKGTTILELGCGCALLGCGLKLILDKEKINSNIFLSDLPDVLNSTKRNMNANNINDVNIVSLDWELIIPENQIKNPDLIVAFDVVYNDKAHKPLLNVLLNLIEFNKKNNYKVPDILIGYKKRNKKVEMGFFEMVNEHFTIVPIVNFANVCLLLLKIK